MEFRFLSKRTIALLLVLGIVLTSIPNLVFALGEQEELLPEQEQQEISSDDLQQIRGVQLSFAPQQGQESVWMGEMGTFYLNAIAPEELGAQISIRLPSHAMQAIGQAQPDGIWWSDTMGRSVPVDLSQEGDSTVLRFGLDAGQALVNQPLNLMYENGMHEEFSIQVSEADILVEELWPEQEELTIGASQSEPLIEDEFEQPEGEDELEQPEGEDELQQPEGEDELQQPEGEDELQQPEGEDELQQPEGEDELQQPEGEDELQQPEGEDELQQPEGEDELQQYEEEEPQQTVAGTAAPESLTDLQIVQSFDVDTTRQLQVGDIEETDWQGEQQNNQQPVEDVQQHPEAIHELSGGTLTFLVQPFSWGQLVLTDDTPEEEPTEEPAQEVERSDLFEMQPRTVGKIISVPAMLYQMGMVQLPERSLMAGDWLSASLDGVAPPSQEGGSQRALDQDYTYHVTIESENDAQTGTIYTKEWTVTQTFTLPQGIAFPQGEAQVKDNQVLIGDEVVLTIQDLRSNPGIASTAAEISSAAVIGSVLTVTCTSTIENPENQTEELAPPDLNFVLHGSTLVVSEDFTTGSIQVSTEFVAVPQTGESVTRSAGTATLLSIAPLSANGGTGTRSTPSVEVTYTMPSTPTFDKNGQLQVTYQIKVKNTSNTDKAEVIITMNAPTETDTTVAPTVGTTSDGVWNSAGKTIIWGDTAVPVTIAADGTWERTVTVTLTDVTQNNPPTDLKSSVSVASSDASAGTTPVKKEYVYKLKEFLEDQKETVSIKTKATYTKEIFWIDDNNTGNRPNLATYRNGMQLAFCVLNKGENMTADDVPADRFTTLTAANMAQVGLTSVSIPTINTSGDHWTASASLPSNIYYGGDENNARQVVWKYVPKNDVPNYTLWDTDNVAGGTQMQTPGWYYLLEEPFTFTVELRNGAGTDPGTSVIRNLIINNFTLYYEAKDIQGGTGEIPLSNLLDSGSTENDCVVTAKGDGTYEVKITGLGTYTANGDRVQYALHTNGNAVRLENTGIGDTGDWLDVEYKTNGVVNTQLFDEDMLVLTLQGTTEYEANKVWLDDGTAKRPEGRFELWRYTDGQSWKEASAVRDDRGQVLTVEIKTGDNQQIHFPAALEKYGPEGYKYIYICKEIIETPGSANYEQVFGSVDQDGKVTDTLPAGETRETGNIYIYDNGTITNRITASRTISATKRWEASSFQSQLSDFVVELQLYSRQKGSQDAWEKVDGKVLKMTGFTSEQLQQSDSMSVPTYDDQGQPLEYKFVEEKVYLDTDPDTNLLTVDDQTGEATITWTDANGQTVLFESIQPTEAEIQAGNAAIVNKVKDTINYDFTKIWQNGWTAEELQKVIDNGGVTFKLYSRGRDGQNKELFEVTLDGTKDDPATIQTVTIGQETYNVTVQELGALSKDQIGEDAAHWPVHIEGLPRYDEGGYQLEYFIFEQEKNGNKYVAGYDITRDPVTGDYEGTVSNPPPIGTGYRILIRKRWIDDSDLYHREDVTITAYYYVDGKNDVELGTLTLEANGVGMDYLYFSDEDLQNGGITNYNVNNVYVLETQMGDTQITGGTVKQDGTNYVGETNKVLAKHHDYEITYSIAEAGDPDNIAGERVYIVTNRRLGSINITAAKSWQDGGKLQQALTAANITPVLVLEFDAQDQSNSEYSKYKIDYDANTVTLGGQDHMEIQDNQGNPSTAILPLNLGTDNSTENYYFFNLPKYNTLGEVVHYTIKEMWVENPGTTISKNDCIDKKTLISKLDPTADAELIELLNECSSSIRTTGYDVSHDEGGDDADDQQMSVTNALSGTKDVSFHKTWIDQYVYRILNKRPDIYLTLYRLNNDSNTLEEVTPYKDRIWTELDEATYAEYQWSCHFSNLPKYDGEGREIFYYATERMAADGANFDYVPVELSYVKDDNTSATDGDKINNHDWKMNVTADEQVVLEGGTFTNRIKAPAEISGVKLWDNLPYLWQAKDLPTVTFTITKEGVLDNNGATTTDGVADVGKTIATVTIETGTWTSTVKTDFKVTQQTDYTMTANGLKPDKPDAPEIPKYNENGQQYVYKLTETVEFEDGTSVSKDQVFSEVVSNGYQIKNEYNSQLGAIRVKKLLQVGTNWNVYPAVTIELMRQYTADGKTYQDDKGFTMTQTWDANKVAEAAAAQAGTGTVVLDSGDVFTFENLEIYQPNGYKYHYYVREKVDGYLNYTSGVQTGNVEVANFEGVFLATNNDGVKDGNYLKYKDALEPTPNENNTTATNLPTSATFGDKYEDAGTASLTGTKVWSDQNDALSLRPGFDDSEFRKCFTLYRSAPAQSGQQNPIPEEMVSTGDNNSWTWTETDGNTWTYTISNLEKIAPNGMEWKYTVKENTNALNNYYYYPRTANVSGSWGANNIYTIKQLNNSLSINLNFQKQWRDDSGSLTNDYLGLGTITITGELYVAEGTTGDLQKAADYFTGEPWTTWFGTGYSFTKELETTIGSTKTAPFANLPRVNKDGTPLYYTVAETKVEVAGLTQEYTVQVDRRKITYSPKDGNDVLGGLFTPQNISSPTGATTGSISIVMRNTMPTQELNVEKKWTDEFGADLTTDLPTEVNLVVQRQSGAGNWTNVTDGDGNPLVVTLKSSGFWKATISKLPTNGIENGAIVSYTYRARELKEGWTGPTVDDDDILDNGGKFGNDYTVSYQDNSGTTVTNTRTHMSLTAEKKWQPGVPNKGKSVTLTLYQRVKGTDDWREFSYNGAAAQVVLDGTADTTTDTCYASDAWVATWKNLPRTDGNNLYEYKVEETAIDPTITENIFAVQPTNIVDSTSTDKKFTVINLPLGSLTIHKQDSDGRDLQGVVFELQYQSSTGNWQPIDNTVCKEAAPTARQTTDADGKVTYTKLLLVNEQGTPINYRIEEISTPDGYNRLTEPIAVSFVTTKTPDLYWTMTGNNKLASEVTYTVRNNQFFQIINTGAEGVFWPGIAGAGAACAGVWYLAGKGIRRSRRNKRRSDR